MTKTMTPAIAIFVKTPGLSPLKTRLAAGIGEEYALEFYHLALGCVAETVAAANIVPYWAIGEENGLSDPLWQGFERLWTGPGGLGDRQHHIYKTLQERHGAVCLICADTPQLSAALVMQAVTVLEAHDFVVGPSRDGGYYLFGGKKSLPQSFWHSAPYSTAQTREILIGNLPETPYMMRVLTDGDEAKDMPAILDEMPENPTSAQENLRKWILFQKKSKKYKKLI